MRGQKILTTILLIFTVFLLLWFLLSLATAGSQKSSANTLRISYYRFLYQITGQKNFKALKANPQKLKKLHQVEEYPLDNRGLAEAASARCIACHGPMVEPGKEEPEAEEGEKPSLHQAMLTLPQLDFECTDCHKNVDTRIRNPKHVTMKIDRKLCSELPCHNPPLMAEHGKDLAQAKKWIANHPKKATSIGIDQCRSCHLIRSELDFCNQCHLRKGFRPASHRAEYTVPVSRIYPKIPRPDAITTKWRGYHFVVAREALEELGVAPVTPQNLPLDKVNKLPCGACHEVKVWCTKCHIKHAPNWLDPVEGHPRQVVKNGTDYCFKCHDETGAKCLSCHTYVGQVK